MVKVALLNVTIKGERPKYIKYRGLQIAVDTASPGGKKLNF